MIDPARRELLQLIEELSATCPEYRFGQMVLNLASLVREDGDRSAWDIEDSEFIEAAQLQGASSLRILATQIVPLCLPSVIIRLTLDMAGIILTAAGLGFLGLGAQPPQAEWGAMVSTGRQVLLDQWWVATIPGAAIFITSLGFNLLGDGLRDVADSRSA